MKKKLVTLKNMCFGDLTVYDNGTYVYSDNWDEGMCSISYWKIENNTLYFRFRHEDDWRLWPHDEVDDGEKVTNAIIDAMSSDIIDNLLKGNK